MTKNEFLQEVVSSFLAEHPKWSLVLEKKREHLFYVGRSLTQVFVHVGFSARSDRELFGQSVGWAPTKEVFIDSLSRKENPPHRPREGRWTRVLEVERPRDFEYQELSFPTSSLIRPVSGFRVSEASLEQIKRQMLDEIEHFAFPYLCLMLQRRFGLQVTSDVLAAADI